ncbi:hypothetical protein AB4Z48_17985 [Cupriavidus sp. 2TAF22]|uniref:hypothetical protein n=1 Tax=unclassified Cupriavidus TaxID=2640874 RepID=UPI003F8FDB1F
MKLRLKELAFDKVSVELSDEFDREAYEGGRHRAPLANDFEGADIHFGFSARILEMEDAGKGFDEHHIPIDVDLLIEGKPKSESQFPYQFSIQASGLFVLFEADETSEDEKIRFAQERGVRPLLAAIREMLASITSRSYWGSILIPEVNLSMMVRKAFDLERSNTDGHRVREIADDTTSRTVA